MVILPSYGRDSGEDGRAIERGENPANTNIDIALDLLYGPLYHRLLHGHAPLNDRFVKDVVETALRGIQPTCDPATTPAEQRRPTKGR